MQYPNTPKNQIINLQSGMYCHITPDKVVINDVQGIEPRHEKVRLEAISKGNKLGYVLNVIFTLSVFTAVLFTSFYPLLLLVFVSIWHIRKLKQQKLPINKSNCIPPEYIEKVTLKKGRLGFNYLTFFIDYKGRKSMKILRLYDSESTYNHACKILKDQFPTEVENEKSIEITGYELPLDERNAYIFKDNELFYTSQKAYDPNRVDAYKYIRWIGVMHFAIILFAVFSKIEIIMNTRSNWIDYLVVLVLVGFLYLPFYYIKKGLPNRLKVDQITKIFEKDKSLILHYKVQGWPFTLTTKFRKKHLSDETIAFIKSLKSKS